MAKKIVLADDEEFIAIAYKDGLTRAGYDVVVARNGEETLEKVKQERPDLVLLDLIMPKMNGFKVLKLIKKDEQLKSIPVIVISNLSEPTDAADVEQLGGADFIVKSDLSLEKLIERVEKVLKEASASSK